MKKYFTLMCICLFFIGCGSSSKEKSTNDLINFLEKSQNTSVNQNSTDLSYNGRVVVLFKEKYKVSIKEKQISGLSQEDHNNLQNILDKFHVNLDRLFKRLSEEEYEKERLKLENQSKKKLPDLNLYFEILVPYTDAEKLVQDLSVLPFIELAHIETKSIDPQVTMNYEPQQGYLNAAPNGINAHYAWTRPGGNGSGVNIIDIENGWNFGHEDSPLNSSALIYGTNALEENNRRHGTAVVGEMLARVNGIGVTGIANGSGIRVVSWYSPISAADAIDHARAVLSAGDIIVLEGQIQGTHGPCNNSSQEGCVPEEWREENFHQIQMATAAGIIVIEAAGNGSENLDDTALYGDAFSPTGRNIAGTISLSGAVIVGAGQPGDHRRESFSNYGSRVNLQGWGSGVVTTGFDGNLFDPGDINRRYTNRFNGTSSASPIVAGAFASVRGMSEANGHPLDGSAILRILQDTGTPQPAMDTGHIGPLPNLQAAASHVFGNSPPTANAGPDQSRGIGDTVTLAGSGTDPDGNPLTYSWSQVAGAPVILSSTTSQNPTFTMPLCFNAGTTFTFELRVSDPSGASASDRGEWV